jgi:hypothetical protein
MTIGQSLGRLERVELRNIWPSEAIDFTPWLARSENLAVLAETLNMRLELEAQERAVGPRQHEWLARRLNDLHRVFAPRVGSLNVDAQISAE